MSQANFVDNSHSLSNVTLEITLRAPEENKSNVAGMDNIPPKFIQIILPYVTCYIHHIFNTILTSSNFPLSWIIAKIIHIPKVSNPKGPNDYRSMSILPYLSKAFERIVADQLTGHFSKNNLISTR